MSAERQQSSSTPQRSLKDRQREQRAELILTAAEAELTERGYHDTSMDAIAARVGIAKGTLYLHFPSKDDLVIALFYKEFAAFERMIASEVNQPGSARSRLEAILRRAYEGRNEKRIELFQSLTISLRELAEDSPKRAPMREVEQRVATSIMSVFEQGQQDGEFDRNLSTMVLMHIYFALLKPRAFGRLMSDQATPADLAAQVAQVFFHGITVTD